MSLLFFQAEFVSAQKDRPGTKDHALVSRMPTHYIAQYKEADFDFYKFRNEQGKYVRVEGHKYHFDYRLKKREKRPGNLKVVRNYTNAIKKIGGTIMYAEDTKAYMKVKRGNKLIWIHVQSANYGASYYLVILEEQEMAQEVVTNAEEMADNISTTGHATVYGIYFDFDKAVVKPESDPTLSEIVKLLEQNIKLKLYVVGHTDNIGEFNYNMKLSQARAGAVVKKLVSNYGVNVNRLTPYGVGLLAPVSSNKTEEGRALNRRVELVEN